jgi:hypothetical protein
MISNEAFVLSLTALLAVLVLWAFKRLPKEQWQILASVPIMKDSSGRWHGLNFTYYGLLTANALVFGATILILLLGALHIPTPVTVAMIGATLVVCLPAAKWVATLIERKQCTFTVAGAFFVGIFVVPVIVEILNSLLARLGAARIPVTPALAAVMVAYAFGEGLGRLACISFGCCYGRSLPDLHPVLRRVFDRWYFVFSGKMKKISYESGLDGKPVVPIQAVTALLYIAVGLLATLLFLRGKYALAFAVAMVVTQGWRIVSEALRADERGGGKISAYQLMTIAAIFYTIGLSHVVADEPAVAPDLDAGLRAVWHPAILLTLQALWLVVFVFFGKSLVTGAEITFHLHHDRI